MAFFSQENLEAVGGRDKIRLCPRCGMSLEYILRKKSKKPGGIDVYVCRKCHRKYTLEDGKLKETV